MKMVYQLILTAVLALAISLGVSCWMVPKVAYVRIGEIMNKYEGMLEAKQSYKNKLSAWQANVDTLEVDYQKMVSRYNRDMGSMSAAEKRTQEMQLNTQKSNIQQYVSNLEKKAQEEDQKMTAGVINQINAAVEEYGKSKGYDYILGTTNEGNILYGIKNKDITSEVLDYLNDQYKKK